MNCIPQSSSKNLPYGADWHWIQEQEPSTGLMMITDDSSCFLAFSSFLVASNNHALVSLAFFLDCYTKICDDNPSINTDISNSMAVLLFTFHPGNIRQELRTYFDSLKRLPQDPFQFPPKRDELKSAFDSQFSFCIFVLKHHFSNFLKQKNPFYMTTALLSRALKLGPFPSTPLPQPKSFPLQEASKSAKVKPRVENGSKELSSTSVRLDRKGSGNFQFQSFNIPASDISRLNFIFSTYSHRLQNVCANSGRQKPKGAAANALDAFSTLAASGQPQIDELTLRRQQGLKGKRRYSIDFDISGENNQVFNSQEFPRMTRMLVSSANSHAASSVVGDGRDENKNNYFNEGGNMLSLGMYGIECRRSSRVRTVASHSVTHYNFINDPHHGNSFNINNTENHEELNEEANDKSSNYQQTFHTRNVVHPTPAIELSSSSSNNHHLDNQMFINAATHAADSPSPVASQSALVLRRATEGRLDDPNVASYLTPDITATGRADDPVSKILTSKNYMRNGISITPANSTSGKQKSAVAKIGGSLVESHSEFYALTVAMMMGINASLSGAQVIKEICSWMSGDEKGNHNAEKNKNDSSSSSHAKQNENKNDKSGINSLSILLSRKDPAKTRIYWLRSMTSLKLGSGFLLPGLQVKFEDYHADLFYSVRELSRISDVEYRESLCRTDFSFIRFAANSKSGQFFFFSHDGRFLVKTAKPSELDLLLQMLDDYENHLRTHPDSLLMRICGLHSVELIPDFNNVQTQKPNSHSNLNSNNQNLRRNTRRFASVQPNVERHNNSIDNTASNNITNNALSLKQHQNLLRSHSQDTSTPYSPSNDYTATTTSSSTTKSAAKHQTRCTPSAARGRQREYPPPAHGSHNFACCGPSTHRNASIAAQKHAKNTTLKSLGALSKALFIVALNVNHPDLGLHSQFDLKGSTLGRKSKPNDDVKKDLDWLSSNPQGIELNSFDKERLLKAHAADCAFLAKYNLLDYSVLLSVHDVNRAQSGDGGGVRRDVRMQNQDSTAGLQHTNNEVSGEESTSSVDHHHLSNTPQTLTKFPYNSGARDNAANQRIISAVRGGKDKVDKSSRSFINSESDSEQDISRNPISFNQKSSNSSAAFDSLQRPAFVELSGLNGLGDFTLKHSDDRSTHSNPQLLLRDKPSSLSALPLSTDVETTHDQYTPNNNNNKPAGQALSSNFNSLQRRFSNSNPQIFLDLCSPVRPSGSKSRISSNQNALNINNPKLQVSSTNSKMLDASHAEGHTNFKMKTDDFEFNPLHRVANTSNTFHQQQNEYKHNPKTTTTNVHYHHLSQEFTCFDDDTPVQNVSDIEDDADHNPSGVLPVNPFSFPQSTRHASKKRFINHMVDVMVPSSQEIGTDIALSPFRESPLLRTPIRQESVRTLDINLQASPLALRQTDVISPPCEAVAISTNEKEENATTSLVMNPSTPSFIHSQRFEAGNSFKSKRQMSRSNLVATDLSHIHSYNEIIDEDVGVVRRILEHHAACNAYRQSLAHLERDTLDRPESQSLSLIMNLPIAPNAPKDYLPGTFVSADGSKIYFVGVIDFLTAFTAFKKFESTVKSWRNVFNGGQDAVSCAHPDFYASRQINFLKRNVLNSKEDDERRYS